MTRGLAKVLAILAAAFAAQAGAHFGTVALALHDPKTCGVVAILVASATFFALGRLR